MKKEKMIEAKLFVKHIRDVESQWLLRQSHNKNLTNLMKKWLNAEDKYDELPLDKKINLKNYIRSYREAFAEQIEGISVKKNESKATVNAELKQKISSILKIKIGEVTITINTSPSTSHLGNGYIRGIGKYEDIWPVLVLITDGKKENYSGSINSDQKI